MTDILIRDVPDDVVAAIDAKSKRVGLSRTEFLRLTLARESSQQRVEVTIEDLQRFSEMCSDLADPDVMDRAWS